MLVPIQINTEYTYYLNLTKVDGLILIDRTHEEGYISGWYLYFEKHLYKRYNFKEQVNEEIDRINKISGKILKIWEQNRN